MLEDGVRRAPKIDEIENSWCKYTQLDENENVVCQATVMLEDGISRAPKIDEIENSWCEYTRLDRLKRWKLKLDRLKSLEVQVENSFTKF